jgi:hypothetical protein
MLCVCCALNAEHHALRLQGYEETVCDKVAASALVSWHHASSCQHSSAACQHACCHAYDALQAAVAGFDIRCQLLQMACLGATVTRHMPVVT